MTTKKSNNILDYIEPVNVNGLHGRMLKMPAPRGTDHEMLFIYGHHSSLERWWGVAQNLNRYAGVTMPDLPGFGGMDSLYKIGKNGGLDNLADYLAAFIKLRYKKDQKIILVGMSLGFVVATRMLQRYPELTKKVSILVSFAGFVHGDDFTFSRTRKAVYYHGSKFFAHLLPATFFRYAILNSLILRTFYGHTHSSKEKFDGLNGDQRREISDVEVGLWQDNDVRTYMKTTSEFIYLDNCTKRVDLPVYHIAVKGDRYFDNHVVEQHMRVVFSDYETIANLDIVNHAPSVIADAKAAVPFIPKSLKQLLGRIDNSK